MADELGVVWLVAEPFLKLSGARGWRRRHRSTSKFDIAVRLLAVTARFFLNFKCS